MNSLFRGFRVFGIKGRTSKDATTQSDASPVPPTDIPRHIDWYAKHRGLPPLIADFIDTHWRSYALRCCTVDGEDSQTCRDAINTIKDLAWSVRPKKDALSRRRLIELVPRLYEQLHAGIESAGLRACEHDAFFAALARLHQAALNPRQSGAEISPATESHATDAENNRPPRHPSANAEHEDVARATGRPSTQHRANPPSPRIAPTSNRSRNSGVHALEGGKGTCSQGNAFARGASRVDTQGAKADEQLLSAAEAADLLGVSRETLRDWRRAGYGPPTAQTGDRKIRYPRGRLTAWIRSRPSISDPRDDNEDLADEAWTRIA